MKKEIADLMEKAKNVPKETLDKAIADLADSVSYILA